MSDFEEIEERLRKSANRINQQVPEDWQHPRSEEIMADLEALAGATENGSEEKTSKVISLPFWLSNLGTAIAACLITVLYISSGSDGSGGLGEEAHERFRGGPDTPVGESESRLSHAQLSMLFKELDSGIIMRIESVLKATEETDSTDLRLARDSLLAALVAFTETPPDADVGKLAQNRQEVFRWLAVVEAHLEE